MATTEITATYLGERIRFDNGGEADVIVGRARDEAGHEIAVKGPVVGLRPQQRFRFWGHWTEYRGEKQFSFQSSVQLSPAGRSGVIGYLTEYGRGIGLGKKTAEEMFAIWGEDAVKTCREAPGRVARVFPRVKVDRLSWRLEKARLTERAVVDLMGLLSNRGFPRGTAVQAVQRWGVMAAGLVQRDPFKLLVFRGCGFSLCDKLWASLGLPLDRVRRQAFALAHVVATEAHGSTWMPIEQAADGLAALVSDATTDSGNKALRLAIRGGLLSTLSVSGSAIEDEDTIEGNWIAERTKSSDESLIATGVADAASTPPAWPSSSEILSLDASAHQRETLARIAWPREGQSTIGVLAGGGGVGKTYTIAKLLPLLFSRFGTENVSIAAPTGKAAVRATESFAAAGLQVRAKTWHSLLGVEEHDSETGGWGFRHDEDNPFSHRVIIGDESSMLDASLFASIMRAKPADCHLLLVGDVAQLAPVGHGAPFRDLIAAGVPFGELTEVHRNSGGLLEACSAIRDGRRWHDADNFRHLELGSPPSILSAIDTLLDQAANEGFDPIWDCQVITALNRNSSVARGPLNDLLAKKLNSRPRGASGLAAGDKLVCTKNGFFTLDSGEGAGEDGKVFVANGEQAELVGENRGKLRVRLRSPDRVISVRFGKEANTFELAYAISCHKSQGSQWPRVLVVVDSYAGARWVCDRSWLYTAVSRAEQRADVIGSRDVAEGFVRRQFAQERQTFLQSKIKREIAERMVESL